MEYFPSATPACQVKDNSIFCKAEENKKETSQHPGVNCFHVGNLEKWKSFMKLDGSTCGVRLRTELNIEVKVRRVVMQRTRRPGIWGRTIKEQFIDLHLVAWNKEGDTGNHYEDDWGQEGLAHVEGELPLRNISSQIKKKKDYKSFLWCLKWKHCITVENFHLQGKSESKTRKKRTSPIAWKPKVTNSHLCIMCHACGL